MNINTITKKLARLDEKRARLVEKLRLQREELDKTIRAHEGSPTSVGNRKRKPMNPTTRAKIRNAMKKAWAKRKKVQS